MVNPVDDELSTLRSQLRDHRQRLRELNRQCRIVQFRTFNYEDIAETRRALSEQLMVEGDLRDFDRRERDALATAQIAKLEGEIEELDRLVKESPPPETVPTPADEEKLVEVQGRGEQLTDAIAAMRKELDSEIVREQLEVQKILAELDVEQRALEECQAVCAQLEQSIASVPVRPPPLPGAQKPPPMPSVRKAAPPPPPPAEES